MAIDRLLLPVRDSGTVYLSTSSLPRHSTFRRLYDITYHVFEVRIDATYHGRGGAVAVGVSAACEAERA